MSRNEKMEREFISEVAAHLGLPGGDVEEFRDQILDRLTKGEEEYEGRSLSRPFGDLIREASEEQTDAGGWSSIALRALEADVEHGCLSRADADLIRFHVIEGTALALRSWQCYQDALALWDEQHTTPPDIPPPRGPTTYAEREKAAAEIAERNEGPA